MVTLSNNKNKNNYLSLFFGYYCSISRDNSNNNNEARLMVQDRIRI